MGSLARGERVVSTETECSRVQEEDRVPSVSPIIQTKVVPWDTYVFLDSLSVTGAVIYSRIQKCLPLGLSIRVSNNIAAIRPHADIYIIRLVGEICLAGEIFVIERKRLWTIRRKKLDLRKFRSFILMRCSFNDFSDYVWKDQLNWDNKIWINRFGRFFFFEIYIFDRSSFIVEIFGFFNDWYDWCQTIFLFWILDRIN